MENRRKLLSSRLCLSLVLASFCVSIEAVVRNSQTMKETLPVYAIADHVDLLNSSKCRNEMEEFRRAVDRSVVWSLSMLDASGEMSSGFTSGNNYWTGDQLQCNFLSAHTSLTLSKQTKMNNSIYRNPKEEFPPFELHFFVANIQHYSTFQYHIRVENEELLKLGLCLPASCTKDEIFTVLDRVLRDKNLLAEQLFAMNLRLINVSDMKDDHQWLLQGYIITIIIILVLFLALIIVATMYDILVYQKRLQKRKEFVTYENNNTSELKNDMEEKREMVQEEAALSQMKPQNMMEQILVCFSLTSNIQQTFQVAKDTDGIPLFHCVKFFGMVWILLVHTCLYTHFTVGNKSISMLLSTSFFAQILSNATLSVDTFFFMGGYLLTYLFLKGLQKERKEKPLIAKVQDFIRMVVKRYIRLTPSVAFVIMIAILNFSWHERISLFSLAEQPHNTCSKYWWRNLLYINNLFSWNDLCLSWSWYIANDMQFFIFGSFILLLSVTHGKTALSIAVASVMGAILSNVYLTYNFHYIPTMDEQYATLSTFYIRPWLRSPPYLVGMGTAFLLHKINYKLHLSKKALLIGWSLAILCNCSILFGLATKDMSLTASVFYTALSRTGWGVGIGWLVVACSTNNAGLLNKFFSMKAWVPLSRLTYCCYLINPFIIMSIGSLGAYPVFIDVLSLGATFLGICVVCYVCAIVLSAMVEVPFIRILRIINSGERRMK